MQLIYKYKYVNREPSSIQPGLRECTFNIQGAVMHGVECVWIWGVGPNGEIQFILP